MANTFARSAGDAVDLTFYDAFVPTLPPGEYELTIQQELVQQEDPDAETVPAVPRPPLSQALVIAGPRWRLEASDGPCPFPPAGGEGSYANVLPQLVLEARALPWERALSFQGEGPRIPWVALLVLGEDQLLVPSSNRGESLPPTSAQLETNPNLSETLPLDQVITSEQVSPGPPTGIRGPKIARLELGPPPSETLCAVIDMPVSTFLELVPSRADLPFLACSRRADKKHKAPVTRRDPAWSATVVANRFALPPQPAPPGDTSSRRVRHNIVHLVSLEGFEDLIGESGPIAPEGFAAVRMVSLHSWSFWCQDEPAENFGSLMLNWLQPERERNTGLLLRKPGSVPTLEGPVGQEVRDRFDGGYVALSYAMRSGEHSFAWYRGPLAPVPSERLFTPSRPGTSDGGEALPFTAADAMIYEPESGLFDLSLANAWSIGRALALADETFALGVVEWRRDLQRIIDLLYDRLDALGLLDDSGALITPEVGSAQLRALASSGQTLERLQECLFGVVTEQLTPAFGGIRGRPPSHEPATGDALATGEAFRPREGPRRRATPARLRQLQRSPAIVSFLAELSKLPAGSRGLAPNDHEPGPTFDPESLQTTVLDWLARKVLLHGVPFTHLIAREDLLPVESLRFFYLDRNWTDALVGGCLSIGLQTSRDSTLQQSLLNAILYAVDRTIAAVRLGLDDVPSERDDSSEREPSPGPMAGFLIRSVVVRNWPGLEVRAWSESKPDPSSDPPMPPLRLERLSETVLLAIYPEVPVHIELGEPSETLALATTAEGVALRYLPGMAIPTGAQVGSTIETGDPPAPVLVDPQAYRRAQPSDEGALIVGGPDGLAQAIQSSLPDWPGQLSSASFALQLVRSPEVMVFAHPGDSGEREGA
ncbi:hypothetical protein OAX78_03110 [Planctomycetota bacterium]|nr:hypothetical protein [Planctomycetota bacterium]